MSFNKVILTGNLTSDVELRYTPKGTAVAHLSLAVNRKYEGDGEKKEEVSFVGIEAWGRQAEILAQYLKKGSPLLVEGRLKQETWEDKNNHQKQSKLKVVLETFQFLGSKLAEPQERRQSPAAPEKEEREILAPDPSQDDVPF